jgi:hypothetical protein
MGSEDSFISIIRLTIARLKKKNRANPKSQVEKTISETTKPESSLRE